MEISRGIITGAQKAVIYGPEGIGKSSIASRFPNPLFSDTEGSTKQLDVARLPNPSSWTMLQQEAQYVNANPTICSTYIVDTADWAERLCIDFICARDKKTGLESWGWGEGYTYLVEEFGRYLNLLTDITEKGIHVVLIAHAQMRKFEQPDEVGRFDRWELKLQRKTAPLVKEWADLILFANYKTIVVNVDNQGVQKGVNKVQGGKRIMHTVHHPCWDAKNRFDLLPEIPLEWDEIKHIFPVINAKNIQTPTTTEAISQAEAPETPSVPPELPKKEIVPADFSDIARKPLNIPKALQDLMKPEKVTVEEIQQAVASKGYYPVETPIDKYDPSFVQGVLIGAWPQVFGMIQEIRETPF